MVEADLDVMVDDFDATDTDADNVDATDIEVEAGDVILDVAAAALFGFFGWSLLSVSMQRLQRMLVRDLEAASILRSGDSNSVTLKMAIPRRLHSSKSSYWMPQMPPWTGSLQFMQMCLGSEDPSLRGMGAPDGMLQRCAAAHWSFMMVVAFFRVSVEGGERGRKGEYLRLNNVKMTCTMKIQ